MIVIDQQSTVFLMMTLLSNYLHILLQVYDLMLHDERYYPSFKQSPLYVRMLAELDMLKEPSYRGSDDGEGESFNGSPTGSISLVSQTRTQGGCRLRSYPEFII